MSSKKDLLMEKQVRPFKIPTAVACMIANYGSDFDVPGGVSAPKPTAAKGLARAQTTMLCSIFKQNTNIFNAKWGCRMALCSEF